MVCKKDEVKSTMNSMEHLKKFVMLQKNSNLKESSLAVLAESEALGNTIIDKHVAKVLDKYQDRVYMIHITDQRCYSGYPFVLKVGIKMGLSVEDQTNAAKLFDFVFKELISHIDYLKLNESQLKVSKDNRSADEKARAQEMQK